METLHENLKVDLCCGNSKPDSFMGIDIVPGNKVDLVHDLSKGIPLKDNSVEFLRAHNALEHLPDKAKIMNEIYRVCKNGAKVELALPSTDGRGAFQDPSHITFWNENSFKYFDATTSVITMSRILGFTGNFKTIKIERIIDGIPLQWPNLLALTFLRLKCLLLFYKPEITFIITLRVIK
ncbi:MAG: methyltransferase domain-containing protein [Candidatus Saganbacteria bacterium]|nr:methyltransferase domain-containing protein [Candidatus Saganbacteria bacterium]